jgi:hypothetical protein
LAFRSSARGKPATAEIEETDLLFMVIDPPALMPGLSARTRIGTMSLISKYVFTGPGLLQGIDTVFNMDSTEQGFFEIIAGASNMLTLLRPNGEIAIEIGPQLNTASVLHQVDSQLNAAGASRTSPIRASMIPWFEVPYFDQTPASHKPLDMLIDANFDFFIETPWYCSNASGTISFFLFFALDSKGHLQARADGDWFQYSGGELICTGAIDSMLTSTLNKARVNFVQPLLDKLIAPANGIPFSVIYVMPSNGTRALGVQAQNATLAATLGLVPNL